MKKLFFGAALAIVAVGAALSSQATIYYNSTRPTTGYNCAQTATLCSSLSGNLWDDPDNVGQGNPTVTNPSTYFQNSEKYDN